MSNVKIEDSWKTALHTEFEQPYFATLATFLKKEKAAGKIIYPPGALIFNAFNTTPFDQVKVVILGQDPYHNPKEAMGLSFSVPQGIRIPPSLRNIYKELHEDLGIAPSNHGDLTKWAEQGVFLLNAMLTVEKTSRALIKKLAGKISRMLSSALFPTREKILFLCSGAVSQKRKQNLLIMKSI